jgi:hypothetical protein
VKEEDIKIVDPFYSGTQCKYNRLNLVCFYHFFFYCWSVILLGGWTYIILVRIYIVIKYAPETEEEESEEDEDEEEDK